jgi:putative ABC transport system permease protein
MTRVTFDVREAVRRLVRDRGYSATVLLTLALTIGGTTAVFSIVNGVLLEPLAYRESHRLVAIQEIWRQIADRIPVLEVNEQHFEYWRAHSRTFESMAQYIAVPANLTGAGDAAQILVGRCSGSFFHVLGLEAMLGRTLSPADEPIGRPEVVVISHSLWRERLAGDPGVLGRSLTLDGRPYTIVGVLPAGFRPPTMRSVAGVDAFVPIHMDAERVGWEGDHNNDAIGRLREGITPEQARAELDTLQAQVSDIATKEVGQPVTLAAVVTPLSEAIVGKARRGLLLLLAAIAAVLLIACSNLANLALTRAIGHARGAAIRAALGASRPRLIVASMLEPFLLAVAGGAAGVAVAWGALKLFVLTAPVDLPRVSEVALDARVLAFAAAVSMTAGLLVAALPAWRLARRDLERTLRVSGLSVARAGGIRGRGVLVAIQIGLSLALLVLGTLLAASFMRLMNVDRGFVAEHVLVVPVATPASRYGNDGARVQLYDRLLAAVGVLPGVVSASTTSSTPLSGQGQVNSIAPIGSTVPRSEQPSANFRMVGPDFFRTMGITIVRGRAFRAEEKRSDGALPALVSASTAARVWPAQEAIGKRFDRGIPGERAFEIVGIAADARITSLDRTPPLMVYVPYWWRSRPSVSLIIRTAVDPGSLMSSVRRTVHGIDPDIAVGEARPLEQLVDRSLAARRYQMQLFIAFGAVALFIAVVGVYAVTSYTVSARRREMNIRIALGAQTGQVLAMIVRQVARPIAIGAAAGLALSLALAGIVGSLLFDIRARDPLVLGSALLTIAGSGMLAAFIATRRTLVVDPARALRSE